LCQLKVQFLCQSLKFWPKQLHMPQHIYVYIFLVITLFESNKVSTSKTQCISVNACLNWMWQRTHRNVLFHWKFSFELTSYFALKITDNILKIQIFYLVHSKLNSFMLYGSFWFYMDPFCLKKVQKQLGSTTMLLFLLLLLFYCCYQTLR